MFKTLATYVGMNDVDDIDEDDTQVDEQEPEQYEAPAPLEAPVAPASSSRTQWPVPRGQMNRIVTIHPKTYNDAPSICRAMRSGIPVVLNLSDVSESDKRRLFDFSTGLALGLGGRIDTVTPRVFLLSPPQVKVTVEDTHDAADGSAIFS